MAVHLRRVLFVLAALLVLLPVRTRACPVCFAGVESPLLDSARLGVLAMAVVTVAVLATLGRWFIRLARLESQMSNAGFERERDGTP
jgi:hypothetical protein